LEFETTFNGKMAQVVMMQGHPKIKRHRHIYLYYEWQKDPQERCGWIERSSVVKIEAAATNR
jgi:hypothetical protein